jgi:methylenetetrahydrofolate dehydrogenase (NADP+)/methenyltetrahydrofolate cyclohydrolase
MVQIIDGKSIGRKLKEEVAHKVAILRDTKGVQPRLDVILVGQNPASLIYIRNKQRACEKCGIKFVKNELPENISEKELLSLIDKKNKDKNIHGILVQLPLPKHIDVKKVLNTIDFKKDVDGFHPINVGKLSVGELTGPDAGILPCTAKGIIKLIKFVLGENLSGKKAIVIGRSNIVGKPTSYLLLKENCTVKMAHSKTENLKDECKWADIIVVAVGKVGLITADMVKAGAVVLDVGMNRIEGKWVGDVDFDKVKDVAGYISPVPGGVGQMTVACLVENVYEAYERLNLNK